MAQPPVDIPALPYTLKTPFLTYAKGVIGVALVAAIGLGVAHNIGGLLVGVSIAFWTALPIFFTNNWQSLSLQSDRLVFGSISGKHRVLYTDISQATVRIDTHAKGYTTTTLWLYHAGKGSSPLQINLKVFRVTQTRILLGAICRFAPQAELNETAMKIQAGEATFI